MFSIFNFNINNKVIISCQINLNERAHFRNYVNEIFFANKSVTFTNKRETFANKREFTRYSRDVTRYFRDITQMF